MIRPGEIYVADLAEAGPHPVTVLSREELNRGRYALVVVCTSVRFAVRSQLPSCVPFRAGQSGFTTDCVAQCENLLSIDLAQIDLSSRPRRHRQHAGRRGGHEKPDNGERSCLPVYRHEHSRGKGYRKSTDV